MGLLNFMKTYYIQKLEEEELQEIQLKKETEDKFLSTCPTFVADQRLLIIFISQINNSHKLYSRVRYELTYHHKILAIK